MDRLTWLIVLVLAIVATAAAYRTDEWLHAAILSLFAFFGWAVWAIAAGDLVIYEGGATYAVAYPQLSLLGLAAAGVAVLSLIDTILAEYTGESVRDRVINMRGI
jgi:hypothetical protein